MLTSDLAEEYAGIQAKVAGQEVTWSDQGAGSGYQRGYTLADMLDLPTLNMKSSSLPTGRNNFHLVAVSHIDNMLSTNT